jgi:hypothetical protein
MPQDSKNAATPEESGSGLIEGLLMMLAASAMESLGEAPGPTGGEPRVNLPQARQMIDLLGALQEKTRGNLTAGEDGLLEQLLFDLRMRYFKKAGPS